MCIRTRGVQIQTNPEHSADQFWLRHKKLASFLIKKRLLLPHYHLLDVGSGVGHLLAAFTEAVESLKVVAVEADSSGLKRL